MWLLYSFIFSLKYVLQRRGLHYIFCTMLLWLLYYYIYSMVNISFKERWWWAEGRLFTILPNMMLWLLYSCIYSMEIYPTKGGLVVHYISCNMLLWLLYSCIYSMEYILQREEGWLCTIYCLNVCTKIFTKYGNIMPGKVKICTTVLQISNSTVSALDYITFIVQFRMALGFKRWAAILWS